MSFDDAEAFIATLNNRIPGLSLSLPSEAQWKYACCSRTYLATYIGKIDVLGTNSAPLLDQIAWYGGNSGEGFELDNGHESRDWPEKQYKPLQGRHAAGGIEGAERLGLVRYAGKRPGVVPGSLTPRL